jgi:hypothetical protein
MTTVADVIDGGAPDVDDLHGDGGYTVASLRLLLERLLWSARVVRGDEHGGLTA